MPTKNVLPGEQIGRSSMTSQNSPEEYVVERIIELRLPRRLGYEKVARDTASSLARDLGLSSERVEALRTAVSQALINAIEHSNDQDSEMRVLVLLADDGSYSLLTHPHPSHSDVCSLTLKQGHPRQWCLIVLLT